MKSTLFSPSLSLRPSLLPSPSRKAPKPGTATTYQPRPSSPAAPCAARSRRLEQALGCSFFTAEHATVLATIDHCTAQIEVLRARIETLIEL